MNNKNIRWQDLVFDPIMVDKVKHNIDYMTLICRYCSFKRNPKFIKIKRLELRVTHGQVKCPNCGTLVAFSSMSKRDFVKKYGMVLDDE